MMGQTKVHIMGMGLGSKKGPDEKSYEPSQETLEMYQTLRSSDDGLKCSKKAETTLSCNMDVLNDHHGVSPSSITLFSEVKLEREKDKGLPYRVELAEEARVTNEEELKQTFKGEKQGDVVLCVRILLASDGASSGRRYTATKGVGNAKLTVSYSLQSAKTGEVALAHQFYASQDCSPGAKDADFHEYARVLVRTLSRDIAKEIVDEVETELKTWNSYKSMAWESVKNLGSNPTNEQGTQEVAT
mmetsp:Transcript_11778/g.16303  ORF Transcript_11778/g.16303 Transcript_11778/m.16303 type:complete len:244 (-) Transcript_11778:510-1241(-)|eukprot:CAMPEP_0185725842 /NCGR_PEP_ID=MMETSP1171-20130828/1992_1 /TAXON_ID=374046 /ORGANISM="Helicotheca tamensis, Strain CCMP826" /LENGTH=243 /DNA_ID=CAMNT_0028394063 /DNA_START=198 /DNA_END=929 /DNA_ORIENTATION=-